MTDTLPFPTTPIKPVASISAAAGPAFDPAFLVTPAQPEQLARTGPRPESSPEAGPGSHRHTAQEPRS